MINEVPNFYQVWFRDSNVVIAGLDLFSHMFFNLPYNSLSTSDEKQFFFQVWYDVVVCLVILMFVVSYYHVYRYGFTNVCCRRTFKGYLIIIIYVPLKRFDESLKRSASSN